MSQIELTKKMIEDATCPKGKRFVYLMDSVQSGFGVQVTDTGSKTYIIRFQQKGKRYCRSFAKVGKISLPAARSRARQLIAEYTLGNDPLKTEDKKKIGIKSITIASLFEKWQVWAEEQGEVRTTVQCMIYSLRQYFDVEKKKANSLTKRDIEGYKHDRLKAGRKPSSINRTLRELKYLYTWANAQGLLDASYCFPEITKLSEAEISPKIHYLSEEEVQKLLDASDALIAKNPNKEYLKDIILFALNTGIRPASICGLEWQDVLRLDSDGGEIRLRAANIKTKKDINLSLSQTAAEIIRRLEVKNTEHKETDKIFTNYTPSHICKSIKKVMKAAGLNHEFSAYSLRHNYATSLYRAGCSAVEIQAQMCHRDFRSTQKYVHTDYEHQKAIANRLSFGTASPSQIGGNNIR